ncbi:MAG: response regulator transcription factor, partial [Saprospiraceae bacterium]
IRSVRDKGFCYNEAVMQVIRDNLTGKTAPKPPANFDQVLTNRELEVLELICSQFTTPEIAEKLFLSTRTVDGHRNNMLSKLGCRNTAGLVVYAIQHGLVKPNPEQFKL